MLSPDPDSSHVSLRSRAAALLRLGVASPIRRAAAGALLVAFSLQGLLTISGVLSARMLGPTDRGLSALLAAVPSTIAIAGSLGLSVSVMFHISKDVGSGRDVLRKMGPQAFVQTAVLFALHVIITVVYLAPKLPAGDRAAAWIALLLIPASFAMEYGLAVLQGQRHYTLFNALRIVPVAGYCACLVVLYVGDAGTLISVVGVTVGATFVAGVITLVLAVRGTPDERQSEISRKAMNLFARKSYLGQVAPMEAFRLDQLLIGILLAPRNLGIYAAASAFTNLPRFLGDSIGYLVTPHLAGIGGIDNQRSAAKRFVAVTAVAAGLVTVALALACSFLIPLLFGNPFRQAIGVAQILLVAGFFLSLRRPLAAAARAMEQPALGSVAEVVALACFAASCAVLMPLFGIKGAALAYAASAMVSTVVLGALLERRSRPPTIAQ